MSKARMAAVAVAYLPVACLQRRNRPSREWVFVVALSRKQRWCFKALVLRADHDRALGAQSWSAPACSSRFGKGCWA